MTSYLGLLSPKAVVGLQGRTRDALAAENKSSKTAHHHLDHFESAHPRVNKRESKALEKQTCQFIEEAQVEANQPSVMSEIILENAQDLQSEGHGLSHMKSIRKRLSQQEGSINQNASIFGNNLSSEFDEESLKLDVKSSSYPNDMLTTQSNYEPVKFRKLSEAESCIQSEVQFAKKSSFPSSSSVSAATSSNDTVDHSSLITKAYSLCEALKGRLLSQQVLSGRGGNDGLSFECCNKHQFIISLSALNKLKTISSQDPSCYDIWCLKCRNFLRKSEEKARSANSTIISSCISQGYVVVRCEHGHQFDLKYTRNFAKTWCEECKNDAILRQKEVYRRNEESEERRKQEEQKRLFEESQKYMEQQQQQSQANQQQQEVEYFNAVLKQVCAYAKEKMERYMSSQSFKGDCTHIEIFNVYKIVYMPFEVLVKTLGTIDKNQLKSYYRKLALILHPDKNKHEMASDAFKKLTQAYEVYKN